MSRMKISRNGLYLIESFEGFRAKAVSLSDGRYTIGFGHAATAREGMIINREQAEQLLLWDLIPIEESVRSLVHSPINQHQFDALVSFVFNIGIEKFKQSEILKHLNQGQLVNAAMAMNLWRRSEINGRSIVVDALIRRRAHEIAMFLEPVGTRPAAPSPVVVPLLDDALLAYVPQAEQIREIKPIPHSAAFEIEERDDVNTLPVEQKASVSETSDESDYEDFATDADDDLLDVTETENHLKILDEPTVDKTLDVANGTSEIKLENEKIANDTISIAKANEEVVISRPIDELKQQGIELKSPQEKTSSNDIANYFMIGAGAIALIASLSELIRFGVFNGNTDLTPNIAFIEIVAAVGFVAIIIGLLSKLKS